jgi:hypothetical protein
MIDKRKEAYQIIQDLGTEFKVDIRKKFGKSYTQVTTDDLCKYINENTVERIEAPHNELVNWLYDSIKDMARNDIIFPDDIVVLADLLTELGARLNELDELS